jgi:hypothetical protein
MVHLVTAGSLGVPPETIGIGLCQIFLTVIVVLSMIDL